MTLTRGKWLPRLVGLLLTLLFLWAMTTDLPLVKQLTLRAEATAYDARLNLTLPPHTVDNRIVIIDIDEKSLKNEGQWPWPRNKIAQLTDNLFRAGAVVVAFDIFFPEKEPNIALEVAQHLEGSISPDVIRLLHSRAEKFDNDTILAATLSQKDTVLGFTLNGNGQTRSGVLPAPLLFDDDAHMDEVKLKTANGYVANNATLQSVTQRSGFISMDMDPDPDGIIRRVPLMMRHEGAVYPSLSLETVRLYLMLDKVEALTVMEGNQRLLEALRLGGANGLVVPVDRDGRIIVPYRGTQNSFPYIPATDALTKPHALPQLEGAIVLVGTTSPGLFDLRSTPVQAVYPGVEVHANIIAAILDKRFPAEPSWATGANILIVLLIGAGLALLLPSLSPAAMLVASVIVTFLFTIGNFWAWQAHGVILTLSLPLLLIASLNAFNVTYGFLHESRSRRQLKEMFGQYVPAERVEEMSQNPDHFGFEGESREMTALFSDVRSFTTISEGLPAARLKEMLNKFFTPMTEIIFRNRGTIDKYVGDMVMAFWGAPVKDEDHAYHAVLSALEMMRTTERLKPEFKQQGFPEINIGIGINTGLMNVGDMGSTYRRAYTVIGDAVNLASRLEGATKLYGAGIVVGESVYEKTADRILYRELDLIRVKGKQQAVFIYEPLCLRSQASEADNREMVLWHEAIECYRQGRWQEARAAFQNLHAASTAKVLAELYLERISTLSTSTLLANWDGVYERESK